MFHIILIIAHATCGVVAFALGCAILSPYLKQRAALAQWFLITLLLMIGFLALALILDWQRISTTLHLIFSGLLLLAVYMGWRGWHATEMLRARDDVRYIDDVGFALITLFTGFVIVSSFDLHAPIWLVLAIGFLGILVGRFGLEKVKHNSTRLFSLSES